MKRRDFMKAGALLPLQAFADHPLPAPPPPKATRKNVSLNTLKSLDPCPASNCSHSAIGGQAGLFSWCGAAYVEDDGSLGSLGFTGGGHGDYYGNEGYAFDLETLVWRRLNSPSAFPGEPVDASGAYPDGKPASSHTYQHLQQLPASMGGGPKGSTILLCSYAAGRAAMGAGVSYRLDHATGEWSRYSTNAAHTSPTPQKTILDPLRKCYWKVGVGGHTVSRLDTSTRTWTDLYAGSAGGNNFGIGSVAAYYPAFDWMIVIDFWAATQAVHLWRLDLKNTPGGWKRLAHTGDVPPFSAQGPSINFSPSLNKFGVYAQRGQDFIRYLNPPDDPAGDWIWTHQTFTGDAPVKGARSTAESYNRMQWIEKLKSWAWFDGVENPVQLWRP